jgi:hypothetical protein
MLGKETCERARRSVGCLQEGFPGPVGKYLEALDGVPVATRW